MSAGFTTGQRRFSTSCMGRETWATWLGEEPADPRQLKALLAPYPSEGMTCWPVSPRVGNVKNNDASLVEPIGFRAWCQGGNPKASSPRLVSANRRID
jgi:hypothetical protein